MPEKDFFDRDAEELAKELLGKILNSNYQGIWLKAKIIETEAYYIHEKGSHSYKGFTPSREAMFMDPGTIYMYYSRGKDSLNVSCRGKGNAVLIKSAIPFFDNENHRKESEELMHKLNPKNCGGKRDTLKLCSGQTLLCKSLNLKVPEWNKMTFDKQKFFISSCGYTPSRIIKTRRLGISAGRDEHLEYRFIDERYVEYCSKPLHRKGFVQLNL